MSLGGQHEQRVQTCPLCGDDLERHLAKHLDRECDASA